LFNIYNKNGLTYSIHIGVVRHLAISAKVLLIGDGSVGKTSLRDKYLSKKFTSNYLPTLGADFVSKKTLIKTNFGWKELKFQIWDLAGQPTFKQTRGMYYRGAVGVLFIFDVTSPESLYSIENWIEELVKNVISPQVALCIIGNKIDLRSDTSVTAEIAKRIIHGEIAQNYQLFGKDIEYLETSAKTGENVDRTFHALGEKILSSFRFRREIY
jgi:small GTP-binding protein